jgi:nicotinic acid phosphoribosyltransferase
MLTRREARDIRKAFTLNDKFRFRRELFANNDAQFAETLNLLSAMQNLDEAIEYLRDDLGWDMDNDDVKDFVNIVNNHFASV